MLSSFASFYLLIDLVIISKAYDSIYYALLVVLLASSLIGI